MALRVLTAERSAQIADIFNQPESSILQQIKQRRQQKAAEMSRFVELCDRFDNLYYPNAIHKQGGADHWPDDPSATTEGRVHVSINVYQNYVDIPASLQSVEPVENIMPLSPTPQARNIAAAVERAYMAWKDEDDYEMKAHQACVVKGLYGRTAAKVFWDEDDDRPCIQIVDQPRNLWLGWATQNYRKLDWAIYCYRISLDEAIEQYGLDYSMTELTENGTKVRLPMLNQRPRDFVDAPIQTQTRDWLNDDIYMVEVLDYWYRAPVPGATITPGAPVKMETRNAILVGNFLVKDMAHPEYEGKLPYIVLFNTYIPGVPDGRGELFDIEQLIREKDERLSAGGQIVRKAVAGQMWQLVGPESPDIVPDGVKPKEDRVVAPGAGNTIQSIQPYVPTFDIMQYLDRIDRELADVSGLNDLLRGLAPSAVLSSSKAIAALVANYESRIQMKRDMYYRWRRDIWEMVKQVWGNKQADVKLAFGQVGRLDIRNPSITPRDDLETATMSANLMAAKIWSQVRAMDANDVDDPEGEQQLIREERTDASLFPADVQAEASVMAMMQQLQQQQQAGQLQAQQQANQAANMQRQQIGQMIGQPQMNGTGESPATPPEAMPPVGPNGGLPMAGTLPPSGPGAMFNNQTQITNGHARDRLVMQQPVAPPNNSGGPPVGNG